MFDDIDIEEMEVLMHDDDEEEYEVYDEVTKVSQSNNQGCGCLTTFILISILCAISRFVVYLISISPFLVNNVSQCFVLG